MNVQLVDELREVADWFRLRGLDENAALLDALREALESNKGTEMKEEEDKKAWRSFYERKETI